MMRFKSLLAWHERNFARLDLGNTPPDLNDLRLCISTGTS
jgi:hypothetical protein